MRNRQFHQAIYYNRKILSLSGSTQFKRHRPVYRFFLLLNFAVFFLKVTKNYEKVIFSCDIAEKSASQHNLTCCNISFLCAGLARAVSRACLWDSLDNLPGIQVHWWWERRTLFCSAFHQSWGKR